MSRGRSDGELIEGGKRTEQKNNEESWSALFSYASFPRQCLVIDCPSRHSRLSDHDDRLYVLVSGKGEEGKCDEAKGGGLSGLKKTFKWRGGGGWNVGLGTFR